VLPAAQGPLHLPEDLWRFARRAFLERFDVRGRLRTSARHRLIQPIFRSKSCTGRRSHSGNCRIQIRILFLPSGHLRLRVALPTPSSTHIKATLTLEGHSVARWFCEDEIRRRV
jgi:hypothetical protein